jgi:hypothetical protein
MRLKLAVITYRNILAEKMKKLSKYFQTFRCVFNRTLGRGENYKMTNICDTLDNCTGSSPSLLLTISLSERS